MNKYKLTDKYMMIMFKTKCLLHRLQGIPEKYSPATALQFQALHLLFHKPNIMVGELAKQLFLSSASTAQLTDRLVIMKWIRRIRDNKDRRVIKLVLTPRGETELALIRQKATNNMREVFSKIPHKDLEELIRIQTDILSNLEQITNND